MQFSPLAQYCSCTEDNQDWQCTFCARYLYTRYDSWDDEKEEEKVEELEEVEEVEENKRQEEVEEEAQSLLALAKQEAREELIFLGFNSRNVKK